GIKRCSAVRFNSSLFCAYCLTHNFKTLHYCFIAATFIFSLRRDFTLMALSLVSKTSCGRLSSRTSTPPPSSSSHGISLQEIMVRCSPPCVKNLVQMSYCRSQGQCISSDRVLEDQQALELSLP